MRNFIDQFLSTLLNPKNSAEKIVSLRLSELVVLQIALFVAICSAILTYGFVQLTPVRETEKINELASLVEVYWTVISILMDGLKDLQPMSFTTSQVFQTVMFSVIITFGGKIFNGNGKFFEALICVAMVGAVLMLLKFFQIILLIFSEGLAHLLLIGSEVWSYWAYAATAAFIHGFRSTLLTFCGGFALSILLILGLRVMF